MYICIGVQYDHTVAYSKIKLVKYACQEGCSSQRCSCKQPGVYSTDIYTCLNKHTPCVNIRDDIKHDEEEAEEGGCEGRNKKRTKHDIKVDIIH